MKCTPRTAVIAIAVGLAGLLLRGRAHEGEAVEGAAPLHRLRFVSALVAFLPVECCRPLLCQHVTPFSPQASHLYAVYTMSLLLLANTGGRAWGVIRTSPAAISPLHAAMLNVTSDYSQACPGL